MTHVSLWPLVLVNVLMGNAVVWTMVVLGVP